MSSQINRRISHESDEITLINKEITKIHNELLSDRIIITSDDDMIRLVITGGQALQTIEISRELLTANNKKEEIELRILTIINKAIFKMRKKDNCKYHESFLPNAISKYYSSQINIQERKVIIEILKKNIIQSLQELSNMTKTVMSENGNIIVTISGIRIIKSLVIRKELFSTDNKTIIEKDIVETINKGMSENSENIKIIISKFEQEYDRRINNITHPG